VDGTLFAAREHRNFAKSATTVATASLIENWIDWWWIAVTTLPITNLSIAREMEKSNAIR
jgi:hypothetical protein